MKTINLEVQAYFTPDGEPTCCRDAGAGQTCRFLHVTWMGTRDICVLDRQGSTIYRADNGMGFTVPLATCPIHYGVTNAT
jgi:hypothetical protein